MAAPTNPAPSAAETTLGDVLRTDRSKNLILEDEWVGLVRSIAAGDQRALHALYERAHRLVFTLAMRITSNRETAEELTLDVFQDVWRRAVDYDPANGSVLGWVMNQTRSRAIDRLRLEQRKKRVNPYQDNPLPEVSCADPHEALERDELARVVRNALLALTVPERQAIETAYFAGLTHAEAAVRLNQPLGTIKTRIRSGLMKLRKALSGDMKP
jgi:RNA polymerase sigma-70 factor (ECF subfamily)